MSATSYNLWRIEAGQVPSEVLTDALTAWTQAFQAAHPALDQDGAFGPATERKWRDGPTSPATLMPPGGAPPTLPDAFDPTAQPSAVSGVLAPPRGHSAIVRTFGEGLVVRDDPARRGAILPDRAWVRSNIRTVTWRGHTLNLHRLIAEHTVAALERAYLASGYMPSSIGTLSQRHILWDPAKPLSTHSYGVALDIDATHNRYNVPLAKAGLGSGPGLAFAESLEADGFTWGGRWGDVDGDGTGDGPRTDAMHFQYGSP